MDVSFQLHKDQCPGRVIWKISADDERALLGVMTAPAETVNSQSNSTMTTRGSRKAGGFCRQNSLQTFLDVEPPMNAPAKVPQALGPGHTESFSRTTSIRCGWAQIVQWFVERSWTFSKRCMDDCDSNGVSDAQISQIPEPSSHAAGGSLHDRNSPLLSAAN